MDVVSIGIGHRPTNRRHQVKATRREETPLAERERAFNVEVMAKLYAAGRDIWTGAPLVGTDADEWLQEQLDREEQEKFRQRTLSNKVG